MKWTDNTKTIARKTGVPVKTVHSIIRDLGIQMHYRSDLRHWVISNPREAQMIASHLEDLKDEGVIS